MYSQVAFYSQPHNSNILKMKIPFMFLQVLPHEFIRVCHPFSEAVSSSWGRNRIPSLGDLTLFISLVIKSRRKGWIFRHLIPSKVSALCDLVINSRQQEFIPSQQREGGGHFKFGGFRGYQILDPRHSPKRTHPEL